MCLATVYATGGAEPRKLCGNVEDIRLVDGKWVFTDIMGRTLSLEGNLERINLSSNFIYIKEATQS